MVPEHVGEEVEDHSPVDGCFDVFLWVDEERGKHEYGCLGR